MFRQVSANDSYLVKRCIGLPGVRLTIKKGIIKINNKEINENETVIKKYKVSHRDSVEIIKLRDNILSSAKVEKLDGLFQFDAETSLKKIRKFTSNKNLSFIVNQVNHGRANIDIIIPRKNQTINLDSNSVAKYKKILLKYENGNYVLKHNMIFLNNKQVTKHVFKYDYYFMMGDNRSHSIDSRVFGLIPENNLIGVAKPLHIF